MERSESQKTSQSGRERLVEASRQAFRAQSYHEVGVAAILGAAEVKAPTLYHHFGDKENLWTYWATSELSEIAAPIRASLEGAPVRKGLAAMARVIGRDLPFDLIQLLRDVDRLERAESKQLVLNAYNAAVFDPVYSLLRRGVSSGELGEEPVRPLTDLFIRGALSLGPQLRKPQTSNEDAAAWWVRILFDGASKKPSAS